MCKALMFGISDFVTSHRETLSSTQQGIRDSDTNFPPDEKINSEHIGGCLGGGEALEMLAAASSCMSVK